MINLINIQQVRGLSSSLTGIQNRIDNLDCISVTGGVVTGDLMISGADLTISGNFEVINDKIYFDTGNGRIGIGTTTPSGQLHIKEADADSTIWLEADTSGVDLTKNPSIKLIQFSGQHSSQIGLAGTSGSPISGIYPNSLYLHNGAGLVYQETGDSLNRPIQIATQNEVIATFNTGEISLNKDIKTKNNNRYSDISSSLSSGTNEIDSVSTGSYAGAFYNLIISDTGNSRASMLGVTWDSGASGLAYTETASDEVGDTSDITLSGAISGSNARVYAVSDTTGDFSVKGFRFLVASS